MSNRKNKKLHVHMVIGRNFGDDKLYHVSISQLVKIQKEGKNLARVDIVVPEKAKEKVKEAVEPLKKLGLSVILHDFVTPTNNEELTNLQYWHGEPTSYVKMRNMLLEQAPHGVPILIIEPYEILGKRMIEYLIEFVHTDLAKFSCIGTTSIKVGLCNIDEEFRQLSATLSIMPTAYPVIIEPHRNLQIDLCKTYKKCETYGKNVGGVFKPKIFLNNYPFVQWGEVNLFNKFMDSIRANDVKPTSILPRDVLYPRSFSQYALTFHDVLQHDEEQSGHFLHKDKVTFTTVGFSLDFSRISSMFGIALDYVYSNVKPYVNVRLNTIDHIHEIGDYRPILPSSDQLKALITRIYTVLETFIHYIDKKIRPNEEILEDIEDEIEGNDFPLDDIMAVKRR